MRMNSNIVPEHKYDGAVSPTVVIAIALPLFMISLIMLIICRIYWDMWGKWAVITVVGIVALLGLLKVAEKFDRHLLHRGSVKRHHKALDQHRDLATRALAQGYSVEFEHSTPLETRKLILTSPLTIPNGPVTIKELNMGEEQQQALLPPPAISQPSMDEMYNAVKYNALEVAFGKNAKTGAIVVQGIIPGVHFKLVGASGFGKSCLAASLLDIATKRNDPDHLRIALLDLENKTSRLFERLPHVLEMGSPIRRVRLHAKDADEVARHLALLRKELDRRATSQVATPLLLIYVEEMLSLQYEVDEALKAQMLADLAILALRGRKYGMFLLACTQTDYSTKELREAQRQFRTRSGFAVDPTAARAAGFVNTELVKYNFQFAKPGQFLLEKPAFSELVLAPLYDVEQKLIEMSNPSRVYIPNSYNNSRWVEGTSESVPDQFPIANDLPIRNQDGRQWEVDRQKLALVREMARQEKGVNEIAATIFPGMRNADALIEVRRYLAVLVSRSEV